MKNCPPQWARQAKNAIVKLNGSVITIPRHMVVATRCNPNAIRRKTRRLQIRAWNSNIGTTFQNVNVLLEVVSACYSGLCRNLGLWNNLRAIQIATSARKGKSAIDHKSEKIEQNADSELKQLGGWNPSGEGIANFKIPLDKGTIHVQVAEVAIALIRSIRSIHSIDSMDGLIQDIGYQLNNMKNWYSRMESEHKETKDIAIDRSGFIVTAGEINFMPRD